MWTLPNCVHCCTWNNLYYEYIIQSHQSAHLFICLSLTTKPTIYHSINWCLISMWPCPWLEVTKANVYQGEVLAKVFLAFACAITLLFNVSNALVNPCGFYFMGFLCQFLHFGQPLPNLSFRHGLPKTLPSSSIELKTLPISSSGT